MIPVLQTRAWRVLMVTFYGTLSGDLRADDEQAVRNELELARSAVGAMQARVAGSEKTVSEKRMDLTRQEDGIAELRRQLGQLVATLDVKRRASELVARQLNRRIRQLEEELQAAVDARRPGEELVAIQKRTNGLRAELARTRERYQYADQIAALEGRQCELEAEINRRTRALRDPRDELRLEEELLDDERKRLADARAKLQALNETAGERLEKVAPPWIEEVRVTQNGREIYKAGWISRIYEVDEQIRTAREMLDEQHAVLASRDRAMEDWEQLLLEQNRECDRLMEEYRGALWMQAFQSIVVELCDSTLTVIWDLKDLGPYAVVLEAGDRLLKVATGNAARDYSLPGGAFSHAVVGHDWQKQVDGAKRNAIKTAVKDAIKAASITSDSPPFLRYGTSGVRVTHAGGALPGVRESLGRVHQAAMGIGGNFSGTQLVDAARNMNPSELWQKMGRRLDEQFLNRKFVGGLARDLGQGVVIEELLSNIEDQRKAAWFVYARADTRRSAMLANFRSCAAQRRADRVILEEIQNRLAELTEERNSAEQERVLNRFTDEVAEGGKEASVVLRFSARDVVVESATLGSPIEGGGDGGSGWTGSLTLPDQDGDLWLNVAAKDKDTNKALDDPMTVTHFVPERTEWTGYEAGPDEHHKIRLREGDAARSFVILIDCSGSMADNDRMGRAKAAAEDLFAGGKFKPDDEIALWIFVGGSISRPVSFTRDHRQVRAAIQALGTGGGTPLAQAILQSGRYLYSVGRGEAKALIVLTDGEAGGVGEAVQAVRRMRQEVELKLQ
jgi:hypothetical protein